MADFGLTFTGGAALVANLRALGADAPLAVAEGLTEQAEAVMTESKTSFVPVALGALRASGVVLPPVLAGTQVEVTMGYGGPAAPYAVAVHENPRTGQTGGVSPDGKHRYRHWSRVGGWKYLELPFTQMAGQLLGRVGAAVERRVARLGA